MSETIKTVDYSKGLTDRSAMEMIIITHLFKTYEPNVSDFKDKIEWYLEKYYQMQEIGKETDFHKFMCNEVVMQMELRELINK